MRSRVIIRLVVIVVMLGCRIRPLFRSNSGSAELRDAQPAPKRQGFFDYAWARSIRMAATTARRWSPAGAPLSTTPSTISTSGRMW